MRSGDDVTSHRFEAIEAKAYGVRLCPVCLCLVCVCVCMCGVCVWCVCVLGVCVCVCVCVCMCVLVVHALETALGGCLVMNGYTTAALPAVSFIFSEPGTLIVRLLTCPRHKISHSGQQVLVHELLARTDAKSASPPMDNLRAVGVSCNGPVHSRPRFAEVVKQLRAGVGGVDACPTA
jgi:hypothetical protein